MTKARIRLGVMGMALVVAGFVVGLMTERGTAGVAQNAPPPAPQVAAGLTGWGYFALSFGPDGFVCVNPRTGQECEKASEADFTKVGSSSKSAIITVVKTNPCIVDGLEFQPGRNFNNKFNRIPC